MSYTAKVELVGGVDFEIWKLTEGHWRPCTVLESHSKRMASLQKPPSRSVLTLQLATFVLGAMPQAIKIFSIRGIPRTQCFAAVYLCSAAISAFASLCGPNLTAGYSTAVDWLLTTGNPAYRVSICYSVNLYIFYLLHISMWRTMWYEAESDFWGAIPSLESSSAIITPLTQVLGWLWALVLIILLVLDTLKLKARLRLKWAALPILVTALCLNDIADSLGTKIGKASHRIGPGGYKLKGPVAFKGVIALSTLVLLCYCCVVCLFSIARYILTHLWHEDHTTEHESDDSEPSTQYDGIVSIWGGEARAPSNDIMLILMEMSVGNFHGISRTGLRNVSIHVHLPFKGDSVSSGDSDANHLSGDGTAVDARLLNTLQDIQRLINSMRTTLPQMSREFLLPRVEFRSKAKLLACIVDDIQEYETFLPLNTSRSTQAESECGTFQTLDAPDLGPVIDVAEMLQALGPEFQPDTNKESSFHEAEQEASTRREPTNCIGRAVGNALLATSHVFTSAIRLTERSFMSFCFMLWISISWTCVKTIAALELLPWLYTVPTIWFSTASNTSQILWVTFATVHLVWALLCYLILFDGTGTVTPDWTYIWG